MLSSLTPARTVEPRPTLALAAGGTFLRAHPWLSAAGGGLGLAAALPPFGFIPGLLGLTVLLHLLHDVRRPIRAGWLATLFAFTFFVAGLYWIAIAFFADAERYGWLAVPAVLGLCALLALTVGVAAFVAALPHWRSLEARALAFAVAWTGAELVRAGTFIQFPWNPLSLVWTASDATMQGVAVLGTYGLSMVTAATAGLLARCLEPGQHRRWVGLVFPVLLVLALAAGGYWRLATAGDAGLTPIRLRLVQADIPQDLKWDRDKRIEWFRRHLQLSAQAAAEPPDALIWPESAVPFQLETDPAAREYIAQLLAPGATALVGGDRFVINGPDDIIASNSMFALNAGAELLARYDKSDLVPFGEFVPLRGLFGRLGFGKLAGGSIDFTPGPGRATIAVPGLPAFSPLICYEAAFPNKATRDQPRPAWLLNITNDGWFGDSTGPYQHLAMARMRAVEEGLPLVRAANTGISVVTDGYGRVLARLGLGQMGVVDARLPEPLPAPSLERQAGPLLLLALAMILLVASFLVEMVRRRRA